MNPEVEKMMARLLGYHRDVEGFWAFYRWVDERCNYSAGTVLRKFV